VIESPGEFMDGARGRRYPADSLACYRWHTGAELRPLRADERCPVLFRDLGPEATALFLRGELRRLAGPLSPIVYMRTEDYAEPYVDHESVGRLLFLRPLALSVWHSGVPPIYVARATAPVDWGTIAWVPGDVSLDEVARLTAGLSSAREVRELFGGRAYDEAVAEALARFDRLAAELADAEERAGPLRGELQSPDDDRREWAWEMMERLGLTEEDLCSAWHHLPRERRGHIREALRRLPPC
jgi:hypothetical protein